MTRKQGMATGLGLGLVMCAVALTGTAWAQGASRFDGDYVGELTLNGIINGDCTKPPLGSTYPLSVSGGVVRFKYVPRFDTVLTGKVDPKGNFKAERRLKSGAITMTGRIEGDNVTATIQSPSCIYSFQGGQ